MIAKIKFKAGTAPQAPSVEIEPAPITIFVGPNNSGKSKVLIEIESWAIKERYHNTVIIDRVELQDSTEEQVVAELELLKGALQGAEGPYEFHLMHTRKNISYVFNKDEIFKEARNPNGYEDGGAYTAIRKALTMRLDGKTRLSLLNETKAGDLQKPQNDNYIVKLFKDNNLRAQVSRIVHDALGKYFVIDPTNLGNLRVRFSNRAPTSESEERGFTDEAIAFHAAAETVDKMSDGVNAFTGIITTLIADNPNLILIDEPEAFLHPALSMKLGKEISRSMGGRKQLFVATHSASFIMGCIQSGAPINIVRLTYKNGSATTRILDRNKLLPLMRNPMLRSTGVLDGLFYEAVIVTEADADRAFYQEINERLRSADDPRAIDNCLFINAQNKQTVWDIVKPLRELGIPAAGIVDLDMVKDGGSDFTKIMESTFVPSMQHLPMSDMRVQIKKALDASVPSSAQSGDITKNWWKRNGGVELLSSSDQQAANNYFSQLEGFGAFVVRSGELEVWLKELKVPANKKRWLADVFVAMGEDPEASTYVKPGRGDVWDFMGRIKLWVDSPTRVGIPD